jgi:NADH dehydrogenase
MGNPEQPRPATRKRSTTRTRGRQRTRIAIVGANFAGLRLAQQLGSEHRVVVIDRSPWFEWLPNIHELVSGVKTPASLRLPRTRLLRAAAHTFVRDEVCGIEPAANRLLTRRGRAINFDACVVAVGGVNDTFGVKGAEQNALPFKSVADCDVIGRRLRRLARQRRDLAITIVGGGLEGMEALGEILRRYRQHAGLVVHVVEAASRLLPEAPPGLARRVRAACKPYGVRFHTGRRVSKVEPARVHLDSGDSVRSDLTIWTGGATAPPLLVEAGLAAHPRQWAAVNTNLQSRRSANVFVIGDAAELPTPISKQAYYAMQMGEHTAGNLDRFLHGKPLRPFQPAAKPALISFGDLDTFMSGGNLAIAGPALAAAKEAVFQITMAQFDKPVVPEAIGGSVQRAVNALGALLVPSLGSLDALRRLPRLRVVGI